MTKLKPLTKLGFQFGSVLAEPSLSYFDIARALVMVSAIEIINGEYYRETEKLHELTDVQFRELIVVALRNYARDILRAPAKTNLIRIEDVTLKGTDWHGTVWSEQLTVSERKALGLGKFSRGVPLIVAGELCVDGYGSDTMLEVASEIQISCGKNFVNSGLIRFDEDRLNETL